MNPGDEILPTHSCFDDAIEYLTARIAGDQAIRANPGALVTDPPLILVHAICVVHEGHEKAGQPFAHAWVEERLADGSWVAWQAGILRGKRIEFSMPRSELEQKFRPQVTTRYTPMAAFMKNLQTKSFGPWDQRYQALCNTKPVPEVYR
jgi:hypothetical protein